MRIEIETGGEPSPDGNGPAAWVASSLSPRFTIRWGMVAIAGAAGVLAVCRVIGFNFGLAIAVSLGLGWLTWIICRRRPDLVTRCLGATYLGGLVIVLLIVHFWGEKLAFVGLVLLILIYPATLGCGLAWVFSRNGSQPGKHSLLVTLLIVGAAFPPWFIVIPAVVSLGFAVLSLR